MEESCKISELIKKYELDNIKTFTWHIQGCSGKTGEGLVDGLHWLSEKIINKKENKFPNNAYENNNSNQKTNIEKKSHEPLNKTATTVIDNISKDDDLNIEIEIKSKGKI